MRIKITFELTAPDEVIAVGLDAGFGAMSSLGFGFCDTFQK